MIEVSLAGAIALAKDGKNLPAATEQFEAILAQVRTESPTGAMLLRQLWQEYVSIQRSATFWENMSDAEKGLSEKMAESNVQLQRNYMRLVQEQ
ncbi:MAG: hypothetical protein DCF25_17240 [Leptolyngbya foveolarum]|uniref:Uncharacterized protein n=1 Tax=Leptolyngbya foveolarum TaxID=47253 RepID=A0A2W4TYB5_9CYAN|nr:MAG: hypothetical protein DCF25_17240 [Leptolyngbya foveolarum]